MKKFHSNTPVRMIGFCAALACAASAANAQSRPNALLAGAFGGTGCNQNDAQAKIMATGLLDSVDILDVQFATPTVAELLAYDAVMVWTNATPQDMPQLSENLADYVDAGGGVVVAIFANSTTTANRSLVGRWVTGGYEVIVGRSGNRSGFATLGTVHQPGHQLMDGVNSFEGGTSSFRPSWNQMTPGSESIADWSDGIPLIAVHGAMDGRADIGFYPPSSDCSASWWDATTDGGRIMANALVYVADADPVCYPDCDGNNQLDFFDFLCFQNAFLAQDPYADCDQNNVFDFFDFLCFQNEFLAGC